MSLGNVDPVVGGWLRGQWRPPLSRSGRGGWLQVTPWLQGPRGQWWRRGASHGPGLPLLDFLPVSDTAWPQGLPVLREGPLLVQVAPQTGDHSLDESFSGAQVHGECGFWSLSLGEWEWSMGLRAACFIGEDPPVVNGRSVTYTDTVVLWRPSSRPTWR